MKNIVKLTLLVILFGCAESMDDVDLQVEKNNDSNEIVMSYCSGFGACLPHVDVYHDVTGTVVSWNGGSCNSYHLSCKGIGQDKQEYVGPSGIWYFNHSLDAYTLSYEICCTTDSRCSQCEQSRSFVKKKNNNGVLGSLTDCQKQYLSYSVEPGLYGGFKLAMKSSWEQQQNTEDYLSVDSYQIYKSNYGTMPKLVASGTISPGMTISSFPNETLQYYEIRFFSKACEHSEEHYLYGTYQGGFSQGLTLQNLNTFNAHF